MTKFYLPVELENAKYCNYGDTICPAYCRTRYCCQAIKGEPTLDHALKPDQVSSDKNLITALKRHVKCPLQKNSVGWIPAKVWERQRYLSYEKKEPKKHE